LKYLQDRNLTVPPYGAAYSVNRGLWGVTIGGKETLTSEGSIPESAWVLSKDAHINPKPAETHTIGFEKGVPVSLDGVKLDVVTLIEKVEAVGAKFGVGRGIHLGDTIIGTKGRVAFEAPAAAVLIDAHRELEKLVLTGRQQRMKELVASPYGDLVHEGQHLEPVCRDIEALLVSSQQRVTGDVKVLYRPGSAFIEGVTSPYSLMAVSKGVYGEAAGEWSAADALGFSKMVGLTGTFWHRAGK
jgi:argininosuccinate synthase